jgi:hypothetical protein
MRRNGRRGNRRVFSSGLCSRICKQDYGIGPREDFARAFLFLESKGVVGIRLGEAGRSGAAPLQRDLALSGKREDKEVAFAGGDDGEETAVGGDGEVAKGEAVEDGDGLRL